MKHAIVFASSLALLVACGDGDGPPVGADAPPDIPDAERLFDGPPEATTINIVVDHEPGSTVHVVYQDGTGAWRLANDSGGGGYSFPISTGRYGYGYTCADAVWQEAVFAFATVNETPEPLYPGCGLLFPPLDGFQVTGHVTGLTGGGFRARIGTAAVTSSATGAQTNYTTFAGEDTDTVAYFGRFAAADHEHVDRLVVRRGLAITGDLVQDVAFATEGAATVSQPVTIAGGGTDFVGVSSRFRATGGSFSGLGLTSDYSEPFVADFAPPSDWLTGDRGSVSIDAFTDGDAYRQIFASFASPADVPATLDLTLPAPLADATFAVSQSGPGIQLRGSAQVDADADVYSMYAFSADGIDDPSCDGSVCFPYYNVDASPGWVGTAANLMLTTPEPAELEALGAWDDRLAVPTGNTMIYSFTASHVATAFSYYAGLSGEATP